MCSVRGPSLGFMMMSFPTETASAGSCCRPTFFGMPSWRRSTLRRAAVCALLFVAGAAHAQPAPSSEAPLSEPTAAASRQDRAAELFLKGRALFRQQDYRAAAVAFAESSALEPARSTFVNLGIAYEMIQEPVAALEALDRALAASQPGASDVQMKELEQLARDHIEQLLPQVGMLLLHTSATPGAVVTVEGRAANADGGPLYLPPGYHRLEATAPGKQAYAEEFTLSAGQRLERSLPPLQDMPPLVAASVPVPVQGAPLVVSTPDASAPVGDEASTASRSGLWGWGLVGGGAALVGVSLIPGLSALSKADTLEERCPQKRCTDPALKSTQRSVEHLALASNVLWITGLVVAGGGVTLLVLDLGQSKDPTSALHADCGLAGCQVTLSSLF